MITARPDDWTEPDRSTPTTPTPARSSRHDTAEEIATRCAWRQVQSQCPALTGVALEEFHGAYRLQGRVPTYYLKQVALAAAREVAAPRPIVNDIEVVAAPPRSHRGPGLTSASPRTD